MAVTEFNCPVILKCVSFCQVCKIFSLLPISYIPGIVLVSS